MLSFGIEYDLAFSIAFWSARLLAGSAPPSLAATMIERASLENSLPRLASAAPFLCLIDDHLLCPDILTLPHRVEEARVDPGVVGELRMEGDNQEPPVAGRDRVALEPGQYLHPGPDVLDPGSA